MIKFTNKIETNFTSGRWFSKTIMIFVVIFWLAVEIAIWLKMK